MIILAKDFNDFLSTFDYRKFSENIFDEISRKNISLDPLLITYKAIPEVSIRLLEKYHNWLNS